jgi:hypothetical protein
MMYQSPYRARVAQDDGLPMSSAKGLIKNTFPYANGHQFEYVEVTHNVFEVVRVFLLELSKVRYRAYATHPIRVIIPHL